MTSRNQFFYNIKQDGRNALLLSANFGKLENVQFLVNQGLKIWSQDKVCQLFTMKLCTDLNEILFLQHEKTALSLALDRQHLDTVKWLANHPAMHDFVRLRVIISTFSH